MAETFKIGLLEDEEFVFLNWEIMAESSAVDCKVYWYESPDALLSALPELDLVVVDRNLGDQDIFDSGAIEKIREAFGGPLLLSSLANPSTSEKRFFDKILYNKKLPSIESLYRSIKSQKASFQA